MVNHLFQHKSGRTLDVTYCNEPQINTSTVKLVFIRIKVGLQLTPEIHITIDHILESANGDVCYV